MGYIYTIQLYLTVKDETDKMCWHAPVNPALERERQEDQEPKDIFQYTVSSRLAADYGTWVSAKDFLKKN